jgi:glycosyltransferase involved in cell wall biosynthesis
VKAVWMLNHYAITPDMPGGTRHFDLACELTRVGYDVTILASAFNHGLRRKVRLLNGEPRALEEVEGVKFVWIPSFAYAGNDWRRLVNMLDYAWRAYWLGRHLPRLEPCIRTPDVVMGCSVHLFAVLSGYYLSRHYGAHFLVEVRDLWPQTFLDMGVWHEGQLQVRFFRWLEQFCYRRAEQIVTLSPMTHDYLARYSSAWADKVVYVPNGTRVARFERIVATQEQENRPLRVMYLGAMGIGNGLDLLLQAMQAVEQTAPGRLECVLVGDGPLKPWLQKTAADHGLRNVRFENAVPRAQVPACAAQADILVLVQREVLYGSSNKLYDYMAAGKPIVFAVFAQHNNLVERVRCGVSASPESGADLAEKLLTVASMPEEERRAMGDRGRAYVKEHHDYSILARRLADTLEELESRSKSHEP